MPTDRSRLIVALDDDTYDKWRAIAQRHGVTLSALIEAIGRRLDPDRPTPLLRQAIADARSVMAERNDRRGRPPESF